MASFSKTSTARLATCHPKLFLLFSEVVKGFDCSIVSGHRGEDEQNTLVDQRRSQLRFPESKHNNLPSLAVDAAPYIPGIGIPWDDHFVFLEFAAYVFEKAAELGIKVRWGGNWKSFKDRPHWELMN